ncbi:signal peptidase II [Varibaculum vaginae]|uniref:signal peptidase II n=1 Tax=Varibaculum vaginae TaxID=2364797 RepID=UPI00135B81F5|nr:signal peptidase II [Varibaculum vaginae]
MNKQEKKPTLPLVVIFAFIAIPVLIIDQLTKLWALNSLEIGAAPKPLIGNLIGLQLVRNPGAAFSLAEGFTWFFSVIAVAVLAIIIWSGRAMTNLAWQLSLGLLAGGALGNLIDRLIRPPGIFRGHVIDFLNYRGMFVGNIADIAIVLGVITVVVLVVLGVPSTSGKHVYQPERVRGSNA